MARIAVQAVLYENNACLLTNHIWAFNCAVVYTFNAAT